MRPLAPSFSQARAPSRHAITVSTLGVLALLSIATPAAAQTLEDAEMLQPREMHTTAMFGRDTWDQYWEGALKRTNGNIGTVTTRTITGTVAYGFSSKLTVLASLPYITTEASQGVLHGESGRQDLTVMAKYRVINAMIAGRARLKLLAVGGAGIPTADYTPDFLPMSIGLHSRSLTGRAALHLQDRTGWFVDGYGQRVWRSNVTLDRSTYFTDGQFVASNEVLMPDVADYRATIGFQNTRWCIPVGLTEQRTLGGGDIRRQDMPFVSNRMDFTMGHAEVMYFLPRVAGLRLDLGAMHTLRGRNVGQSTTIMTGLTYALHL
ncbi:MAG: hypothetical protein JWO05_840 [Gemmatimonadetes bacterium]|nr:hypothetical protein [Gemmatimonadota bacterium]